jgi:DNA (cytosine-5)-methyltransferase 1
MNFIEVCAGCGGLSSGFIKEGFKPLLLCEIDKNCCKTLEKNHSNLPDLLIENCDLKELDLNDFNGEVDILMGGIPCQPFSTAGLRRGFTDLRGQLIFDFNRLILECNPRMIIVENVKGLLSHNNGDTIKAIINLLENDGKYVVKYKVLNAKDFSVPQKRERLIIVGVRKDLNSICEYNFPEKNPKQLYLRDVLVGVPASMGMVYNKAKEDVMKLVPAGGCWVDLPDGIREKYMGNALHSGGGKRGMARRLAMDEQCLTLTTSPCQKQTERCHPTETRPFNVREYARIQTFDDDYKFVGSISSQYKQIGNAVPVALAQAIAKSCSYVLNFSNV